MLAAAASLTAMGETERGDLGGEAPVLSALAELREPDPRSMMWIVGGAAAPVEAAEYQMRVMAQLDVPASVPEAVRKSFDRIRAIYRQGLFCYDLYTVAGDQARLLVELALKERFVEFYGGTVLFTDGQGNTQAVTASAFAEVYRAIRKADGRSRHWKIQLRSGRPGFQFTGGLASLLRWARGEGLLTGQGDRMRDVVRKRSRDRVAHPDYHLETPDHAVRAIADAAHVIRQLWGAPSGTTVARYPVLLSWTDTEVTRSVVTPPVPGSRARPARGGNRECVIVLADPEDPDLFDYDSRFESTSSPCDLLWGPGDPAGALEWLAGHHPAPDTAWTADRLFLLQYRGDRLSLPRSPAIAAVLRPGEKDGTWYLIRADMPSYAFNHQRRLLAREPGHAGEGECESCPVDTIGSSPLPAMLRLAERLGADVTPRPVPFARVTMSRMPACNRILPGSGWDIPPDDPSMARLRALPARPAPVCEQLLGAKRPDEQSYLTGVRDRHRRRPGGTAGGEARSTAGPSRVGLARRQGRYLPPRRAWRARGTSKGRGRIRERPDRRLAAGGVHYPARPRQRDHRSSATGSPELGGPG